MNALQLLKKDHRAVESIFKKYESLGERATGAKRAAVERIIRELSLHAAVEESAFYPAIRGKAAEQGSDVEGDVLEALEEHHIVKWTLSELQDMKATDERFDAKVTVLMEHVRHHVKEEEQQLFKAVQRLFDASELRELGKLLETAKKLAPTRPHPRAPDQPPMSVVADVLSGVVDRGRDMVRDVVREGKARTRRRKRRASTDARSHD